MRSTLHAEDPRPATRRRLRAATVVCALAALFSLAGPAAADTHGYPRTLHIWGGWYGADALKNYDMVIGYESNWDVAALRRLNPDGLFYLGPGLTPRQGATYNQVHLTYGAVDTWTGGTCPEPVGWVPAFDPSTDYLRRPDGSLALVGNSWRHPGFNMARPATAVKVAKIFACAALRDGLYSRGWDGVWSDNWIHTIGASWFYGSPLDTDRDGVADAPADLRRRWDNGLALAGKTLRSLLPGKSIGGNGIWYGASGHKGDDPTSWLGEANVTLMEYQNDYYRSPRAFIELVNRWLSFDDPTGLPRAFGVEQAAMTAAGGKFTASGELNSPANMLDAGVMKGMRWGLTLALMTGAYFEVNPDQMHDARWWYDEYDGGEGIRQRGYLGDALAAAAELVPGVWRRDFADGIALNNSTDGAVTVRLEVPYRHLRGPQNPALNDGSVVDRVTVPAHDGVILLRTVPAPDRAPGTGPGTVEPAGGGSSPSGQRQRRIARFWGARVIRRGHIAVRVRGIRGGRTRVVVRGPQGRILARKVHRVRAGRATRYRLRLRPYVGQRVLRVKLDARRGKQRTRSWLVLRLGRHGGRIVRATVVRAS